MAAVAQERVRGQHDARSYGHSEEVHLVCWEDYEAVATLDAETRRAYGCPVIRLQSAVQDLSRQESKVWNRFSKGLEMSAD
jgi:hypothetical protein